VAPNSQTRASARSPAVIAPNNPFTPFAAADIEQSLASRFEQIVARDPAHLAVKTAHESVSYGELNRMANRIAHQLLSASDTRNTPVAVVVENNLATIAAILGVLKAGKIFVPLDVAYSPAWARFIIADTDTRIVLAGKTGLRQTALWFSAQQTLIDFDAVGAEWSEESPAPPAPPNALSHILYTSGSTGHPKGVMDDQRNTLHYVMRLTNASHISAADRVTLVRPPSSSGALMNLYLALLNGSTLFPIDLKQVEMKALGDWLRREAITILHCGGTVFRHFAQQLQASESFPDLRLIRLSSGQVYRQDIELFQRHFPASLLLHVLSSTEANTYRVHFVDKDSPLPEGALPVGYPVQDMEVLIVDDDGKVLAENQVGEIAIRSGYLFPGYWNNAELTRSAFVNPADGDGRRTFRTGDLGRLNSDQCLEYLGRKDFRLKIRGYSIQAEQVESALLEIAGIAQAAVAAHKDSYGDDRLVAYLAGEPEELPTIDHLRVMLDQKLPDYMIPSRFVFLKRLPLNPNGKVNRHQLPAPDSARPRLETVFAAPVTPLQQAIAKIYGETLGVNDIGIDDSFFDLGGDSLIAGRILSRLGRIFPWQLTLPEFYDAATVAKTAQLILQKAPNAELANTAAQLALAVDQLTAAEVTAMVAAERGQRR